MNAHDENNRKVVTSNGTVTKLGSVLGAGLEGEVFELGRWRAAKIYGDRVLRKRGALLLKKLNFLSDVAKRLRTEPLQQVIWPRGILRDESGAFIGFEMVRPPDVINLANQSTLAAWSVAARAGVGRQLSRIYSHLHAAGFLVADAKLDNALYSRGTGRVLLADADSLHHARHPAPTATIASLPPATFRRGKPYVASKNSDNHALAVQLFALLVRNQHPYAAGARIEDCVKLGVFPYPYQGKGSASAVARSDALQAWLQLPEECRDLFSQAFHDNCPPAPAVWTQALTRDDWIGETQQCKTLTIPKKTSTRKPRVASWLLIAAAAFAASCLS